MQGLAGRYVGHSIAADEMARQGLLATGTDGLSPVSNTAIPTETLMSPVISTEARSAERRDGVPGELASLGYRDPCIPELFPTSASLREAAAARVAAHRNRRAGAQALEAAREEALRRERAQAERNAQRGVSRVRDTVRARYENSPSYRDFLAAEAERATQQACAEAEIAARNARAIADAQFQLLEELKQPEPGQNVCHPEPHIFETPALNVCHPERSAQREAKEHRISAAAAHHEPHTGDLFADALADLPLTEISTGGLTVRLYDDLGPLVATQPAVSRPWSCPDDAAMELEELEQEIAFRRAPEFIDHIIETMPIPANLIEFPRELVATRKARPRLAEGPLREDVPVEPQLRIFEVEPETISTEPVPDEIASAAPVWQGLLLDAPRPAPAMKEQAATTAQLPDIAPIPQRLMAATVDACCIGAACIGFATTVAYISGPRLQALSHALLAAAVLFTLGISTLLYQLLFFSLNERTPGMRYARIGLCTFADANPTRRAMRRRVLASVLAACPLGLGLLWAWLDDDRLGWHDRISRMYHRSY